MPGLKQKAALLKLEPFSTDSKDAIGKEETLPDIETDTPYSLPIGQSND